MVSLLAHEISEAITNPDLATGYYYTGSDGSKVSAAMTVQYGEIRDFKRR